MPSRNAPISEEVEAVHTYFGLTYANYLVRPRTLLQSMPDEWQSRFVDCLRELDAAFDHIEQAPGYEVQPVDWRYANELSPAELRMAGASMEYDEETDETTYYDRDGNELNEVGRVAVPAGEPIPHYQRGRERVEPNLEAMRAARATS